MMRGDLIEVLLWLGLGRRVEINGEAVVVSRALRRQIMRLLCGPGKAAPNFLQDQDGKWWPRFQVDMESLPKAEA